MFKFNQLEVIKPYFDKARVRFHAVHVSQANQFSSVSDRRHCVSCELFELRTICRGSKQTIIQSLLSYDK